MTATRTSPDPKLTSDGQLNQGQDVSLERFEDQAVDVLGNMRTSLANLIASLGGARKPTDLRKNLKLDWTLSWQLFQVAGAGQAATDVLAVGSNVPSRTSIEKFARAAENHGAPPEKIQTLLKDYDRFEQLVEVHAGDRNSFNTMVSAAAGVEGESLSTDAQHYRNAFRAMSHVTGMQAKAKFACSILSDQTPTGNWDIASMSGYIGLRMLRSFPSVPLMRMRLVDAQGRPETSREPLGLSDKANGHLIEDYSSTPLPDFSVREDDTGWCTAEIINPPVGNLGATSMRFGGVYRNHPVPGSSECDELVYCADANIDKPVEVIYNDLLCRPGLMRGVEPLGSVFMGGPASAISGSAPDPIRVPGDYTVEFLGTGPDALATPDVPDYPEMIRAAANKLGWDIQAYEVYRVRIEFPIYLSTARIRWDLPPLS